jgi:D-amino peptidase
VEAALDEGATHILVNDAHGTMTNLWLSHMDERVELLSGKPKICAMAAGLNETYDAAVLIGYHARAGTAHGTLSHTFHDKLFDVRVNGVSYGEAGINGLYAGLVYGVPVVLASGDDRFCTETETLLPGLALVQTKTGLGYAAAQNRPVADVLLDYQEKTRAVMRNRKHWKKQNLLTLEPPYELEVTFINTVCADTAMMMPGLRRVDGRTVAYRADDFRLIYQALQTSYALLAYTGFLELKY